MIDFLSEFREIAINYIKKEFEQFGFNQKEKELFDDIKIGKLETLTGKKTWQIIQSNHARKTAIQKTFDDTLKKI